MVRLSHAASAGNSKFEIRKKRFGAVCTGAFLCLLVATRGEAQFSQYRKSYLAANTFKEAKINSVVPANIESIFFQIMKDVVHEEPEIAANMVFHTHNLIVNDIESQGEFKPLKGGESHILQFIETYEYTLKFLDCVGLMVRTYREDAEGVIGFRGQGNEGQKIAVFSHFLSLGGNYDTAGAMDLMVKDLRRVCGEGEMIFLTPYFFDFAYQLRPAQRDQLATWALDKNQDPDATNSAIGNAVHLGLALFERAERCPISTSKLWRGNELDGKLIDILQDNQLSPAWRAGFTALMGENFREEMTESLRLQIGRVITEAMEKNSNFPGRSFKFSIAAFLRGNHKDPEWINQAKDLVRVWEKRSSITLKASELLNPDRDWIVPMTELICRIGTKIDVTRHYQRFCFDDLVYPGIWINLIKSGFHSLANEARTKQGVITEFNNEHYDVDLGYDAELEAAIPAYLQTIDEGELRTLTELQLAATPDLTVPKSPNVDSNRQGRLDAFAKKYQTCPKWTQESSVRAFEILSFSQRNQTIDQWLTGHQMGLEERIEQDEPSIRPYWAARIEMHSAAEMLEKGEIFGLNLWWGFSIFNENQTIARCQGDLCKAILIMLNERVTAGCETRDKERLTYFLPMCRDVLETAPDYIYYRHIGQFTVVSLTAHALCGEINTWSRWWQSLDPVRKRHLISTLENSDQLIPKLEALLNPNDLDPDKVFKTQEERIQIMLAILTSDFVDKSNNGYSDVATGTAHRLFTGQDLKVMAERIARSAPRGGSSWREYLGVLADQSQLGEALRIVEDEIAATDPTLPLINALKIEKVQILRALHRESEAEEFLSGFAKNTDLNLPIEYIATKRDLEKR